MARRRDDQPDLFHWLESTEPTAAPPEPPLESTEPVSAGEQATILATAAIRAIDLIGRDQIMSAQTVLAIALEDAQWGTFDV
jgi:hypothetical protein